MNTTPNRNPSEVIDQMIEACGDKHRTAVIELQKVKSDDVYRAPEMKGRTWKQMQEILHDEILAGAASPDDFTEIQKAVVRIFTGNPNAV